MPYTLSTPLQMCLIYHFNPYPRATRSYHPRLDVIRKRIFLLETKVSECDDFISLCETYLVSRYSKKARLEAEQTTVAVGSPRAKRIRFALKLTSECIGKAEKQLREAKAVKDEGEEYMDRLGCKELKLVEKEDRKTKKLEEDKVKRAKNMGKERLRLGGTWHIWGSMTTRHGHVC